MDSTEVLRRFRYCERRLNKQIDSIGALSRSRSCERRLNNNVKPFPYNTGT